MKKQENKSSDKALEAIMWLFSEASIDIPDACIDRAHRVSRNDDTVIVHFYNISSNFTYQKPDYTYWSKRANM